MDINFKSVVSGLFRRDESDGTGGGGGTPRSFGSTGKAMKRRCRHCGSVEHFDNTSNLCPYNLNITRVRQLRKEKGKEKEKKDKKADS